MLVARRTKYYAQARASLRRLESCIGGNSAILGFRNGKWTVKIPEYDIFSGSTPEDANWLETVKGFGAASEKMIEHANKVPGTYFVFCRNTQRVLARINTGISEDMQFCESA